ncbi:hypothetical protein KUW19_00715 [Ferrimonas balearica]|uniref:hypothetical protein n=1 Tax=Ferrimonas balearica TaxID=44012 RepID=UPI001C989651|nr:hypothetical protein [Ferrimonas balearica]MBY6104998.1 hypothetical protein [Ferrimonas balearica]
MTTQKLRLRVRASSLPGNSCVTLRGHDSGPYDLGITIHPTAIRDHGSLADYGRYLRSIGCDFRANKLIEMGVEL